MYYLFFNYVLGIFIYLPKIIPILIFPFGFASIPHHLFIQEFAQDDPLLDTPNYVPTKCRLYFP